MKRKILFIISNLQTGGVSKSITSLLNVIDRERYDVSLMIVSPTGAFMELLPDDLRILTNPIWAALTSRLDGCLKLVRTGHPFMAIGNAMRLGVSLFSKSIAARMIAAMMPAIKEEFDTIVDFNGQQQLYYMVDKLKARKKVSFFHSDYEKWPYYYGADKKYYPKVDNIFTISPKCVESLKTFFPALTDKIGLMENISSMKLIDRLAGEPATGMPDGENLLLTVGHVCENKGILWAIEAASILKKKGIEFNWYFVGSVDNPDEYARLIELKGVADRIVFLGIKTNPYPYIRKAEVIVHPSKFEGRSIALDEAKLLCKPVVATDFSTVYDQFEAGVNATICKMNSESLADAIEDLLLDSQLREKYERNLRLGRKDNTEEILKLYRIFDA